MTNTEECLKAIRLLIIAQMPDHPEYSSALAFDAEGEGLACLIGAGWECDDLKGGARGGTIASMSQEEYDAATNHGCF